MTCYDRKIQPPTLNLANNRFLFKTSNRRVYDNHKQTFSVPRKWEATQDILWHVVRYPGLAATPNSPVPTNARAGPARVQVGTFGRGEDRHGGLRQRGVAVSGGCSVRSFDVVYYTPSTRRRDLPSVGEIGLLVRSGRDTRINRRVWMPFKARRGSIAKAFILPAHAAETRVS